MDSAAALTPPCSRSPSPEEPEPAEPGPEPEPKSSLPAGPLELWSEQDVLQWVDELTNFETEWASAVKAAFEDEEDVDGEELASMTAKRLQKLLRSAKLDDPAHVAQTLLKQRDAIPAEGQAPTGRATPLRVQFDRERDLLGNGRFGEVFRCSLDGQDGYAVKRIIATKALLIAKEIEALTKAQQSDDGGHRNVVKYFCRERDPDFIYVSAPPPGPLLTHRLNSKCRCTDLHGALRRWADLGRSGQAHVHGRRAHGRCPAAL